MSYLFITIACVYLFVCFEIMMQPIWRNNHNIMLTSPYNVDPLTPHFYIVKLGCTGVYMFSYFCSKT